MMNIQSRLKDTLAIGVATLTLVGAAVADLPKEIRVGVASVGVGNRPDVGGWLPGTVHAQGALEQEFKADGIKINWHFFKSAGPGVNESLTNNLLDIVFQGDLPSIIGKGNGLPTKLVLGASRRGQFLVATKEDSDASAIEDLRGRKVALFKGTCTQLAANRLLAANGLQEKDLKVYNMNDAATVAALASKDVEAAFGGASLYAVRDRGLAKKLYDAKQVDGGQYGCSTALLVTEPFAKQYPDVVKRFVKAVVKVAAWSSEEQNRNQLYQLWTKSGTPFKHWKENFEHDDLRATSNVLLDDFQRARYKQSIADAKKFGLMRADVDVDTWFDSSYLDAALKELNLQAYWTPEDGNGQVATSRPTLVSGQ